MRRILAAIALVICGACATRSTSTSEPNGARPAPPPRGVEQRDILRCAGNHEDGDYGRTQSSSCKLLASSYERADRRDEALRFYEQACDTATEPNDMQSCTSWITVATHAAEAQQISASTIAHVRERALDVCQLQTMQSKWVCMAVASFFERVVNDLDSARIAHERECDTSGEPRECRRAQELGAKVDAEASTRAKAAAEERAIADQAAEAERRRQWDDIRRQREATKAIPLFPAPVVGSGALAPNTGSAGATASPNTSTPSSAASSSAASSSTSQVRTLGASTTSDYWFADDGTCCEKLFEKRTLAVAAMSRECRRLGGFAKEETVRWSGASYCSNEACNGRCAYKFRCQGRAEGHCQLPAQP